MKRRRGSNDCARMVVWMVVWMVETAWWRKITLRDVVSGDEHLTKGEREKLLAIVVPYPFTTRITCVRYCLVANV